eukprot:Phypoly_transcript_12963.p2 GENE.Phypoly_transcript_12963~~Phypoly_transcript_12963.p2  ORF type:complete len:112 (+),score=9.06 Phypoly_transcript_12963:752-1087(+)
MRMTGFIVAYAVTWLPFFGMFLVDYLTDVASSYQVQIIIGALDHSQGISNFFLYFLNKRFKNVMREELIIRFPSIRKKLFSNLKTDSGDTPPETTVTGATPREIPLQTLPA